MGPILRWQTPFGVEPGFCSTVPWSSLGTEDVSLEESSGVVSFPCHLVYVMIPVKLVVDVDPEVLC